MTSRTWHCLAWTIRKPSVPVRRRMVRRDPIGYATAIFEFKRQFPELRNHTVEPEK